MSENDDDYQDMDGGKPKYATAEERSKGKYGDKAAEHSLKDDPKMEGGMNRKQRRCQDIICLIIFIAYVGAMGFITFYGFIHGDVTKLLAPLDGNNHFCGVDNGKGHDLTDYPYMYIGNMEYGVLAGVADPAKIFSTGVCVSSCPKNNDGTIVTACKPGTTLCTDSKTQYTSHNIFGLCLPLSHTDLNSEL